MLGHESELLSGLKGCLLDRLTDDSRGTSDGSSWAVRQSRREWEESLLRDVEALLNTKRALLEVPEQYRHASSSLLQYGLPDFSSMSLHSPTDRAILRSAIETALRLFEPRLASVAVTLDASKQSRPVLHFRVNALLRLTPQPEPIRFDTLLKSDSREFVVVREGA